jgi:hypothetical protein
MATIGLGFGLSAAQLGKALGLMGLRQSGGVPTPLAVEHGVCQRKSSSRWLWHAPAIRQMLIALGVHELDIAERLAWHGVEDFMRHYSRACRLMARDQHDRQALHCSFDALVHLLAKIPKEPAVLRDEVLARMDGYLAQAGFDQLWRMEFLKIQEPQIDRITALSQSLQMKRQTPSTDRLAPPGRIERL